MVAYSLCVWKITPGGKTSSRQRTIQAACNYTLQCRLTVGDGVRSLRLLPSISFGNVVFSAILAWFTAAVCSRIVFIWAQSAVSCKEDCVPCFMFRNELRIKILPCAIQSLMLWLLHDQQVYLFSTHVCAHQKKFSPWSYLIGTSISVTGCDKESPNAVC